MKIIIALLIFGIIVFVHELGHFLLAKANGIFVEEFSIGMGPRVFTLHGKKTSFSLRLLPLGGSTRMNGSTDLTRALREDAKDFNNSEAGSFFSTSPIRRFFIFFAGPFINILLALILFIIISFIPVETIVNEPLIVNAADYAFLFNIDIKQNDVLPGDKIIKLDGNTINTFEEAEEYLKLHNKDSVNAILERNGILVEATLTPIDGKFGLTLFQRPIIGSSNINSQFKEDDIYKSGYVFVNERLLKSRNEVVGLLPSVRDKIFNISIATGRSGEDIIMEDNSSQDSNPNTYTYRTTIGDIADINYAIVYKALCKYSVFKFNVLKSYFPNLKSTKEFVYDKNYLGNIRLHITSKYEMPTADILYSACVKALGNIAESISGIEETYEGSSEFTARYIHDIFKNKRCNYIDPHDSGLGISQNDNSVPIAWKMDLSKEDWFVFEDNYGTSEEKAFVAYFKEYVKELKDKYDKVYLVRNERQLAIYSFDGGERFEPDYLLFLHLPKQDGYEQLQIFIEPKGTHLVDKDSWKEDFLLQLESKAIPVTKFADDNKYKIWGFHFFNRDVRTVEFDSDMKKL